MLTFRAGTSISLNVGRLMEREVTGLRADARPRSCCKKKGDQDECSASIDHDLFAADLIKFNSI